MNHRFSKHAAALASVAMLAVTASFAADQSTVFPGKTWQTKTPQQVGLIASKLDAFAKAVGGDGVVIRNGYLVKSWGKGRRGDWASSAKPVISTLLLFAVQEGKLKSVDEPVRPWVQKRWPGKDLIEKDRAMTFRHLADMTSGYSRAERPGTHWAYNDLAINLYRNLMVEVLGESLNDAALARLAALQFEDGDLFGSRGGGGVNTSPRDFARIGWFWMHEGNWNGKQLLPREYFEKCMRPDVPRDLPRTAKNGRDYLGIGSYGGGNDQNFPGQGVYGFNWWFNARMAGRDELFLPHLPDDAFCTIGHQGREVMLIVPSWRLVAAARGNWGGVRLEKTRLLREAVLEEPPTTETEDSRAGIDDDKSAGSAPADPGESRIYFPPPGQSLDNQNQRSPEEVGLSDQIVDRLKAKAPNGRWALWRHGYLVHVEGDFHAKSEVKSLRKTWHALTVGAAVKQGKVPSLDQKLSVWNPELKGTHAAATWRHVITQTSGFDYPYADWPAQEPGRMWTYSDKNPRQLCNALARVYGRRDYRDHYEKVVREAYFDAIGMQGWKTSSAGDGVRFHFDLEDMGRLGLLVLCRGRWNGAQLISQDFVEALETKQTRGVRVNYNGPDDGKVNLDPASFPEAPYGFMTWVNTADDYYPGADTHWAWGAGAGGSYILWNHTNGIVFAGVGIKTGPTPEGIPHAIENSLTEPNPLVQE
jgi:CubicO group peptidase (beta-lactamase class C family)